MIATLPMYDDPAIRGATDTLWAMIRDMLRADGIDAPEVLTRDRDLSEAWTAPDLLLGQTCSLPYRLWVYRTASVLGAFDYGLEGTPAGDYYSVYVAARADRRDDLASYDGARLAYNSGHSQSGWAAPWMERYDLVPQVETGSHRDSIHAVIEGQADIAAIDAVTWRLLTTHHTALTDKVKVVGRSESTVALPLITCMPHLAEPLRLALQSAAAAAPAATGICGFVPGDGSDLFALPNPPDPSAIVASLDAEAG